MRNFLEDAPARSIDIIANEDTIEMVLNESAMQMLSQAAAPTEPPCPPGPNPVLKEPEVPVAGGQAVLKEPDVPVAGGQAVLKEPGVPIAARQAVPPERRADPLPERRVDQSPERRANPPERRADDRPGHSPEGSPEQPSERLSERRPPMSTLRFAILLGVVAVGSAIGTALTYLATTGALRSGDVATSVVSRAPAAHMVPAVSVAPAASVAPVAAPAPGTPTAAGAPGAPVTATASAPVTPVAPAATAAAPLPPSVRPVPRPLPQPLPSTLSSAQSSVPSSAPSPATDSQPVRIVNPFDRREVFEFPAGTTKAEARDAAAELLYERAQDRQMSARSLVSGTRARHTTSASAAAAPSARKAQP